MFLFILQQSVGEAESRAWLSVYHLGTSLMTSLLSSLSYNFLQDALNYVGVHQDRMVKASNIKNTITRALLNVIERIMAESGLIKPS